MFNAIKYTQELEKVGFSKEQAEAALNMVHKFSEHNLATKQDAMELKHAIETLEYKMTIKLGTIVSFAVGIAVALAKLFT